MEVIGKVLSLTLLTIFGSAAAAVYLVDSDFFPSFIAKTLVVYTSDTITPEKERAVQNPDILKNTYCRKHQSQAYIETAPKETHLDTNDRQAIWGHSYTKAASSAQSQSERAGYLARENSLDSLKERLRYWNRRYRKAIDQGQTRTTDLAFQNFKDYEKAIEIKRKTGRD
jgi:hypothetical protein